jgi:hypothetical protein
MDFEIKGKQYRAAKLSVFDQLKVSRKLLPLIAKLVSDASMLRAAAQNKTASKEQLFSVLETILPKIADVLADMPDETVNSILHPCFRLSRAKVIWVTGRQFLATASDVRRHRPFLHAQYRWSGGGRQPGNFLPAPLPARRRTSSQPDPQRLTGW